MTAGLRQLFFTSPDYLLLANLKTFSALQVMIGVAEADIILMELYDTGLDLAAGISFIKKNRQRWTRSRLVILTTIEEPGLIKYLLTLGVHYCLSKRDSLREIMAGLDFSSSLTRRTSPRLADLLAYSAGLRSALTLSELNVALLLARNNTLNTISLKMNLSYKTIHTHKTNLMKKLNLQDMPQLIKYLAVQHQQF